MYYNFYQGNSTFKDLKIIDTVVHVIHINLCTCKKTKQTWKPCCQVWWHETSCEPFLHPLLLPLTLSTNKFHKFSHKQNFAISHFQTIQK